MATALPSIQRDLHAQINWSGWTITAYSLGQLMVMPVAGKLSDQLGRKKVFLASAVIFTVASVGCGVANDIYVLVVLRALQAVGGGAFMPSATGIVSDHFGSNRDRAVGMFASVFPIGGTIGPVVGGFFVTYWSWRAIFLINVPVGVLVIVLTAKFIPSSVTRTSAAIDVRGICLLGGTILSTMFALAFLGLGVWPRTVPSS